MKPNLFSMGLSLLFCWFIHQYPQAYTTGVDQSTPSRSYIIL